MTNARSKRYLSLVPVLSVVCAALVVGCSDGSGRQIKLATHATATRADVATGSSILRVSSEEQRALGILMFENVTGDASLDWLRRGLTDMLTTELSRSPYLKVLGPSRLDGLLQRVGRTADDLRDDAVAARVVSEAQVESFIVGRFRTDGDELVIDVELLEIAGGQAIRRVQVRGPRNLERLFLMVGDLSKQLREDLRGDLKQARNRGLRIGEMTASVEAYRHYSSALASFDKLIYPEANEGFEAAVEADPTFASAWLRLFMTRNRLGERDGSLAALEKAREFSHRLTREEEISLQLHEAAKVGDLAAMRSAVDRLLDAAPGNVDARMDAAGILFNFEDRERALVEYEAIIEAEPDRKLAYNQLAYLYAYRGDFASARRYLERYRELTPDEPNAYDSTGEILMMEGRLREAAEYYEQALRRRPDFPSSLHNLVDIYAELGDARRALGYADRAIATAASPMLASYAQIGKAMHLWRLGRREAAFSALDEAELLAPERAEADRVRAEMLRDAGEAAEATAVDARAIAALRERAEKNGFESDDGMRFLSYVLANQTNTFQLNEVRDALDAALARADNGRLRVVRVLALLHSGSPEAALRALDEKTEDALRALVSLEDPSRQSVWKHLGNGIERALHAGPIGVELAQRLIASIADSGRERSDLQVRLLELQMSSQLGELDAVSRGLSELGFPAETDWRILGPFAAQSGFEQRFAPEIDGVDAHAAYEQSDRSLVWEVARDGRNDGFVDLAAILKRSMWGVAYASIDVVSPVKRAVQLRLGSDESCKLWLNSELVWQAFRRKPAELDADMVKVNLHRGRNTLLLKVGNEKGDWGFHLRITGDDGRGVPGLQFQPIAARQQAYDLEIGRTTVEN